MKSFFIAAAIAAQSAFAHMAMVFPEARNYRITYNQDTGANGQSVCGSGRGSMWPADDTIASSLEGSLTTPLTTLVAGGMVDVEIYFSAFHFGHAVVELCANPGETITDDCFVRLTRDPTDTRHSPFLADVPTYFFMPDANCIKTGNRNWTLKGRYQIPQTAISEHAVLRYYWQSGNSCESSTAHNFANSPDATLSAWRGTVNDFQGCKTSTSGIWIPCGTDCPNLACVGEQFRNCADVKIVSGSAGIVVTKESHGPLPPPTGEGVPPPGSGAGSEDDNTAPSTGEPVPNPIGDGLDDCLLRIRGTPDHFTSFCQQTCRDYAETGSFGSAWCTAAGHTNLKDCVSEHQTACE